MSKGIRVMKGTRMCVQTDRCHADHYISSGVVGGGGGGGGGFDFRPCLTSESTA